MDAFYAKIQHVEFSVHVASFRCIQPVYTYDYVHTQTSTLDKHEFRVTCNQAEIVSAFFTTVSSKNLQIKKKSQIILIIIIKNCVCFVQF